MFRNAMVTFAMAALLGSAAAAAGTKPKAQVLKPGEYTATAKALVCSACAGEIEKALKGFAGIKAVTVEAEEGIVRFTVKKGALVNLAKLQAALKGSSDKMGMGADYTLHDIQQVRKAGKKG